MYIKEDYLLHVKDTLVDFEKEQANAAKTCKTCFPIHYK